MKRTVKKRKLKRAPKAPRRKPGIRKYGLEDETEQIILAIRRGKIDALMTEGPAGDQVVTLQGAEHPYRVLVETISDGVATLDDAGVILYANTRFAAILRVSPDNFIGNSMYSFVSPSDQETLRSLISAGVSGNVQGEINLDAEEGRPRLVRLAINPIGNSNPRTVCLVATELTELVEANNALRSNEESLRQLSSRLLTLQDEERRHIARDLHDITGQKLAVQSMSLSQMLTRNAKILDEESRGILAECSRLNKLIGEEIRTLSYLLHPPLLDELGLSSAVKWYAEGFGRRTGIEVTVDIEDFARLPPDVEVTLFRVIQESLTNIHRYSESPKAVVQVKIKENELELQIRDFGKGVRPDILNPRSGQVVPLGVGIQGMKERMRQLSGKLGITSKQKQGTLVTATFPIAKTETSHPIESAPPVPVSISGAQSRNPSRKQILIADDHELLRRGLRAMLEKEASWEICGEATNGQDAVNQAIALSPDLVILDINMPTLNGLAAVRQILRNRPHTKILIFTVHESEQTIKEIRAAGAHGYLSKSNASAHLLQVVRDLLEENTPRSIPATNTGN
ncbi:MAG: response regulator [Acidobacteriia bacterium]|nr:response regulator [Terriglobia bacterium]